MTQPTEKPSSLTAAVFGEKAAAAVEANAARVRAEAEMQARRDRVSKNASLVLFLCFIMACVFGLVMGCLALWNTVVA